MHLILHKFVTCVVLVGFFLTMTVCTCVDDVRAAGEMELAASAPCHDRDADHHQDQDHPHDDGCQCAVRFVSTAPPASGPILKAPTAAVAFFPCVLDFGSLPVQQSSRHEFNVLSGHTLTARNTLLRLHCALMV